MIQNNSFLVDVLVELEALYVKTFMITREFYDKRRKVFYCNGREGVMSLVETFASKIDVVLTTCEFVEHDTTLD